MAAIIANPQLLELLIGLATNGITSILSAFHKTGAAAAVNAADQVAMAVLQQTATIKGLTIDWSNPTAVQQYIASLPAFVPIPEPAPTSAPAAPAPTAPKA